MAKYQQSVIYVLCVALPDLSCRPQQASRPNDLVCAHSLFTKLQILFSGGRPDKYLQIVHIHQPLHIVFNIEPLEKKTNVCIYIVSSVFQVLRIASRYKSRISTDCRKTRKVLVHVDFPSLLKHECKHVTIIVLYS